MFVTRDSVYMGIHESATETNLWRYYLPTGGIARNLVVSGHTSSATAKMLGITQTGTSTPLFVYVISGVGVYKEKTTYVDNGYIITALADFYTSEKKQWVGAKLSTENIQSGAVKLFTSTFTKDLDDADATTWEEQVHLTSGVGGDEQVMELVNGRWITAKITLSTVDNSQTPKLLAFAIRGFQLVED